MHDALPRAVITDFFQKREASHRVDVLVLLILFGVALFQSLGRLPLIEPDEGRYAEIPREMLEHNDFLTPRLNYVKYFEKPPLYYWLNCISFSLFGQNEFAARFFSALSALLGILLTYQIGRAVFGRREGLLAAMVLGTSMGYLVQGRLNTTDMALSLFMTATLGFFLLASGQDAHRRTLYFYLSCACAALAVLTKGPIGIILPGAIIALYLAAGNRWSSLRVIPRARGIAIFLLLSAPWFILVSIRNPEFPRFFFVTMHLQRFLAPDEHFQPLWFFIPILLGFMFPWSCFLPAAASRFWNGRGENGAACRSFLWLWLIVIFCFFSLSRSKLVTYILPSFPAVALLVGHGLSGACDGNFKIIRRQAYAVCLLLIIGAIGIALYPMLVATPRIALHHCAVIGMLLLAEGLLCLTAARRGDTVKLVMVLCAMSYILGIVAPPGAFEILASEKSEKKLGLLVRERASPEALVASYGWYDQDLPFYTQRRIAVVGTRGELAFGSRQERGSAWFPSYGEFSRLWDSGRPIFLLIKRRDMPLFDKSVKAPIRVLGREAKNVLITNQK